MASGMVAYFRLGGGSSCGGLVGRRVWGTFFDVITAEGNWVGRGGCNWVLLGVWGMVFECRVRVSCVLMLFVISPAFSCSDYFFQKICLCDFSIIDFIE